MTGLLWAIETEALIRRQMQEWRAERKALVEGVRAVPEDRWMLDSIDGILASCSNVLAVLPTADTATSLAALERLMEDIKEFTEANE